MQTGAMAGVVAQALAARNLSAHDLAATLEVDPAAVETFLRGGPVSRCLLEELAEALELDAAALERGESRTVQRPSVFLRHQGVGDFDASDRVHLDRALDSARALHALRVDAGAPEGLTTWREPTVVAGPQSRDAAWQGHQLATRLRQRLGLGEERAPDLRRLLEERFGVAVEVAPLRAKSPAQAVLDHDAAAGAVVLNGHDDARRQNPLLDRVHLAHELCHLCFDVTAPGRLHLVIERDEGPDPERVALEEARARAFAAEFLLPFEGMKRLVGEPACSSDLSVGYHHATLLRNHFETPWEIALRHLQNRGFLSPALVDDLLARPGATPPPTTTLPPVGGPSLALTAAALDALAQERVTEGEVRTMLRRPPGSAA